MKKILFMLIISNFIFSGTVYMARGESPRLTTENEISSIKSYDLDDGGITLGYNHPFYKQGKIGCAIGVSYMFSPIIDNNSKYPYENSDDLRMGFLSFYLLPSYSINEKLMVWFSLGLNSPNHSGNDFDTGLTIGYGVHYKINDKYGVGFGSIENNTTHDLMGIAADLDHKYRRQALFLSYTLP